MSARLYLRLVHPDETTGTAAVFSCGPGIRPAPVPDVESVGRPTEAAWAPCVPRPVAEGHAGTSGPARPGARRARMILTVLFSLAAHAGALLMLAEVVSRQGDDTTTDAVSVEIVDLPAPVSPTPDVAGSAGQSTRASTAAETPRDMASRHPDTEIGKTAETDATQSPNATDVTGKGEVSVPQDLSPSATTSSGVGAAQPIAAPPQEATKAGPSGSAMPTVIRTAKPVRRPPARPTREAAEKPAPKRAEKRATNSGPSPAAGSTAGASISAGARNAYFRKLLGHVQHYKTYPAAAERAGMTGAALVSITIDRSGRLVKARVLRGSGHAILDNEALSVAGRAAPFPAPPDGVGSSTFSFSVTLRFSRAL